MSSAESFAFPQTHPKTHRLRNFILLLLFVFLLPGLYAVLANGAEASQLIRLSYIYWSAFFSVLLR